MAQSKQQAVAEYNRSVRQMSRAVRQWSNNELRREMTKASREAAKVVVPYVKKHVPVDTGMLKKSVKPAGTKTIPKIKGGITKARAESKRKAPNYAWIVHRGHKTKGGGREIAGIPFMRRGISESWHLMFEKLLDGQRAAASIYNRNLGPLGRLSAKDKRGFGKVRL